MQSQPLFSKNLIFFEAPLRAGSHVVKPLTAMPAMRSKKLPSSRMHPSFPLPSALRKPFADLSATLPVRPGFGILWNAS